MTITVEEYFEYLKNAAKKINENKDYITKLDATTGDGDHWVNMNMGFDKLLSSKDELVNLRVNEFLKKIGMLIMATVGGSSGALYGSAYINAAKRVGDVDTLDEKSILTLLDGQLEAIMKRGKAEYGYKTMIDSLYPAVQTYKEELAKNSTCKTIFEAVQKSSEQGMLDTKEMKATKGRASYREDKGVGHLDPGAVTMYYQISELMKYLQKKI